MNGILIYIYEELGYYLQDLVRWYEPNILMGPMDIYMVPEKVIMQVHISSGKPGCATRGLVKPKIEIKMPTHGQFIEYGIESPALLGRELTSLSYVFL